MNEQIIYNLYEFWEKIGIITNKLIKTETYSSVTTDNSDWPNRVFNFKNDPDTITKIIGLSNEKKVSDIISGTKNDNLGSIQKLKFVMNQKNMAIDMDSIKIPLTPNQNIKQVKTEKEAVHFAKTATEAFGYKVDANIINEIVKSSERIRLFTYQEKNEYLGSGIVYFDSNNNAGFHMIGTIPKGRGKGIGKSMTERLLQEAKINNVKFSVLHASLMGESIYKRFGFETYGEIETYRILK